jgi:DNA-binding NtrC family response regulator
MKERILVVSEGEGFRMVFCPVLSSAGYQCREAASPKEALSILTSREVGVVLWSLWESCEAQSVERAIEAFPDIPVVVTVAPGLHCSEFGESLRKRAYGYLVETIEREQLIAVLRRASEYRRLKLEDRARAHSEPCQRTAGANS